MAYVKKIIKNNHGIEVDPYRWDIVFTGWIRGKQHPLTKICQMEGRF